MEISTDDVNVERTDINFENIFYTVSVPKQKGECLTFAPISKYRSKTRQSIIFQSLSIAF